jgi:choline dehydrogenase-like flavoprotein
VPPRAHRLLPNIIRDPIPAALAVYLRFTNSITKKQDVFGLDAHFEQTPRPDNRVTLSDTLDGEGLNRVHLHWTLGELEERTVLRTIDILDDELRVAGIGWIRNKPSAAAFRRHVGVTHHHMGTTRMHSDPLHGVVDEDCKVHGISNLFIAGSSVFPTGGAATATMTLVTLAIRLADHVKTLLKPAVLTAEAPAAEV